MEARSTRTATTSTQKVDDDSYRHWSPNSQTYAPADVLVRHLRTDRESVPQVTPALVAPVVNGH